jgi:DNA-3-methyladenine glycosylase II
MYRRLGETVGTIRPEAILRLDDDTMRSCGFTRQKADYARGLAEAVLDGLDLDGIASRSDAVPTLTRLHGIGRWTAECYLLFCAGDRDVFPAGDLALRRGWQELSKARATPAEEDLRATAEKWAPRRSAAAHLIWHCYLRRRGRR